MLSSTLTQVRVGPSQRRSPPRTSNICLQYHTTGGLKIEGEDEAYDFGSGAGFYVDATASPWSNGYKMYTYITSELPTALWDSFPELDSSRVSITGHSMGGHGALTLFLKNPGMYKSCSAFAPIANPSKCPWGEKAFKGYFGEGEKGGKWKEHDATELVKRWKGPLELLIDVVRIWHLTTVGSSQPVEIVSSFPRPLELPFETNEF